MTEGIDFTLEPAGIISGMVTDSEDPANPLPWIWVDACHESVSPEEWGWSPLCSSGETDEFGYYEIPGLVPGNYRVQIWHPEWLGEFYNDQAFFDDADYVLVNPGEVTWGIDFALAPAAAISGTVLDTDGQPVIGVLVEVNDFYTYDWVDGAETDEGGNYFVPGLAAGDYRVCIWNPDWVQQCYYMTVAGSETLVALGTGEHRDDIDFLLTPAVP
jgi:hypothetical protein